MILRIFWKELSPVNMMFEKLHLKIIKEIKLRHYMKQEKFLNQEHMVLDI